MADLQLFLLIFPFSSIFAVLPAATPLQPVVNALNSTLPILSLIYLVLMNKQDLSIGNCTVLFIYLAYLSVSLIWVDDGMKDNSFNFILRTLFTVIQTFVIVKVLEEQPDGLMDTLKKLAILVAILCFLFLKLFPAESTWTNEDNGRMQSFFSAPNNMGQFLAFAFLIVNFYKRSEIPLPLLAVLDLMLVYLFLQCDSMTSLGGIVLISVCFRFKFLLKPLFIGIVIAGLIVPHINKLKKDTALENVGLGSRDLTFTGRTEVWDILLHDLDNRHRTAFGFGWGGYWVVDNIDRENPITSVSELDWDPGQGHNGYLDTMVMAGIFGLVIFVIFLFDNVRFIFKNIGFDKQIVYLFTLIIMFNNITEASFFRAKHWYFVLLMLTYWYARIKVKPSTVPSAAVDEQGSLAMS